MEVIIVTYAFFSTNVESLNESFENEATLRQRSLNKYGEVFGKAANLRLL